MDVILSTNDPRAQDLLAEYAKRVEPFDPKLAEGLRAALPSRPMRQAPQAPPPAKDPPASE
jgi:hypothetical protein